jgi:hypothetical protein
MSVNRSVQMAALSAVVQALFILHAFDRQHKKPTKLVADKSHLRATSRVCPKEKDLHRR